jgi:hypothetical protein
MRNILYVDGRTLRFEFTIKPVSCVSMSVVASILIYANPLMKPMVDVDFAQYTIRANSIRFSSSLMYKLIVVYGRCQSIIMLAGERAFSNCTKFAGSKQKYSNSMSICRINNTFVTP